MNTKKIGFAALLAALVSFAGVSAVSKAQSISSKLSSGRTFGGNIGIGDPFPGLIGINAAYNLNQDIRLTAGYAEVEVTSSISFNGSGWNSETIKAQTYGLGAQYLFTDWAVRPTLGLHAGYFSVSGKGDFDVNGFDESTAHGYSNVGFDWISSGGMHLATGMNVALINGSGSGFYANLGYFF